MSQSHDIQYVDFFTYDVSYTDHIKEAYEEGACSRADSMKSLTLSLLENGCKDLLLEIIQANLADAEVGYFIRHRDAQLESLEGYIQRTSN